MLKRVFLVIALSTKLFAQDASTGAVRGTVSDASGAAIVQAAVALTNSATGITRSAATTSSGTFAFDLLPPGEYVIAISATNFASYSAAAIKVDVGGAATLAVTLKIAGASESVSVSAASPIVET
jgi:hypothetical protein